MTAAAGPSDASGPSGAPENARKWEQGDVEDPDAEAVMDAAESEAVQAIASLTGGSGEHRRFWLFESEQRITPFRIILLVAETTFSEALILAGRQLEDPRDAVHGSMLSLAWAIAKATERAARGRDPDPLPRIQAAVQARYTADFIADLPPETSLSFLFKKDARGKRYLFWALHSPPGGGDEAQPQPVAHPDESPVSPMILRPA